jgi:hypothetical protein
MISYDDWKLMTPPENDGDEIDLECPECEGWGLIDNDEQECPECNGTGIINK